MFNYIGSQSYVPNGKGKKLKLMRTRYHGNVTEPLIDIAPPFVRKIPIWKRVIDIVFSLFGIIFMFPLLLLFSIFIKIVSPGPVFFKQERVGCGGKIFSLLKLRTMKPNVDTTIHRKHLSKMINGDDSDSESNIPMKKIENDSRVIPFGNFLRDTGMDELPQLINVLLGEMSLVGPRPPITYEVDEYRHWFSDRFDIVPGLTGLWQVSGKNKLTYNEMVRLDIQYTKTLSFWRDIKILVITPFAVINILRDIRRNK